MSTSIHSRTIMIAHAGGGIDGFNYSNSVEALNYNYAQGYRIFEIDFSWTSDNQLVCLHDWKKRFKKLFGYKLKQPLSFLQFQKLLDESDKLHPCTLESFAQWVMSHPNSRIITDIKSYNIDAIKLMTESYPEIKSQLIPQFYQPMEYKILKDMGFDDLIWILYQYTGSLKSVAQYAQNMELLAISMRPSQAKKNIIQKMIANGINVFVYTINKEKTLNKLISNYNVKGIYTDFLKPNLVLYSKFTNK